MGLQTTSQGQTTPSIVIEGSATDADILVLAGAIREFGKRVGLEKLCITKCPALGEEALCALIAAALDPGLRLLKLDLSGNHNLGLGESVLGSFSQALRHG